jgi:hypothetical protein
VSLDTPSLVKPAPIRHSTPVLDPTEPLCWY